MVRVYNGWGFFSRVNYISDFLNNPDNASDFKFSRPVVVLCCVNISAEEYNRLDCRAIGIIIISLIINHCGKAPDLRCIQVDIELSISVIVDKKSRCPKSILEVSKGFKFLYCRLVLEAT